MKLPDRVSSDVVLGSISFAFICLLPDTHEISTKSFIRYGKMDVKPALAIFSKETAAGITELVQYHGYPNRFLTTAQYIYQVRQWS